MPKLLSPAYLRSQALRCQRLSAMCMDLGIARDLRLMAEEYIADAARMEQASRNMERAEAAQDNYDSRATLGLRISRS